MDRQNEDVEKFASKLAPSADKLRGGYYTPQPIAQFLARWVAEAGPRVLEPSCGDGGILAELAHTKSDDVFGVEIFPAEAAKASERAPGAQVITSDFFSWFTPERHESFDGVAGNPPYIRFGSWEESSREVALKMMRNAGLKPNKLTNAWVPFVVASVLAVRQGGRIGLVIPAELLQVGYAAELRSFLVDNCENLKIVAFKKLVFPEIQQEVLLLLATKGAGPANISTVDLHLLEDLETVDLEDQAHIKAHLHEREKWTKYFLPVEGIEALRDLRDGNSLKALSTYASVDVGVVTGRNAFFCMTAAQASERGVEDLVKPLVSRSNQLGGIRYRDVDAKAFALTTANTRLLALEGSSVVKPGSPLAAYIAQGEQADVHTGYKCRIRRSWWVVPTTWVPDGFMLRQISTHPRIIANETGATSTDTVHRVRVQPGIDVGQLAAAAFNSATFALSEIIGRSYGGGVLELEPSEAEELPVPDPRLVSPSLIEEVDALVRDGKIYDALDLVDQAVLIEGLGMTQERVNVYRVAWESLKARRAGRKGAISVLAV